MLFLQYTGNNLFTHENMAVYTVILLSKICRTKGSIIQVVLLVILLVHYYIILRTLSLFGHIYILYENISYVISYFKDILRMY